MACIYPVSVNGFCSICLPLALTSCPPFLFPLSLPFFLSLPLSLIPSTESVRAKLHLVALQPFCLSGWFTLHWPGLGLPGLHYQLLATGTHCSWQTQGKGTPHRNYCSGKGGWGGKVFPQPLQPSPGPDSVPFTLENFYMRVFKC